MNVIREEREKQFDPLLVDAFCALQPQGDLGRLAITLEQEQTSSEPAKQTR
jgi:response regulator RpfG family c-di-GMP phosphodiesterase